MHDDDVIVVIHQRLTGFLDRQMLCNASRKPLVTLETTGDPLAEPTSVKPAIRPGMGHLAGGTGS